MISKKEWEKSFQNIKGRKPDQKDYEKAIAEGLVREEALAADSNKKTIIIVGSLIGGLLVIVIGILLLLFFYPKPSDHQSSFNQGVAKKTTTSTSSSKSTNQKSEDSTASDLNNWQNLSLNEQIALLAQAYAGLNTQTTLLSADKIAMTANGDKGVNDGYIQWYDNEYEQHHLNVLITGNTISYRYTNGASNTQDYKAIPLRSVLSTYYQTDTAKAMTESIASRVVNPSELEKSTTQKDLDITAISAGDISSLVGEWKNAKGALITINSDQTIFLNGNTSEIGQLSIPASMPLNQPYLNLTGIGNAALALFKIGSTNLAGDMSDITKPRILITQQAGNFAADEYYYRA